MDQKSRCHSDDSQNKVNKGGFCCSSKKSFWGNNKLILLLGLIALIIGLSYVFPILMPFRHSLFEYFKFIWWAVSLGLVLGGIIDYYIPREYISKTLGGNNHHSILNAIFYGFLMSACCHGILALAIQLHKKGASTPAIMAFFLASPWANIAITVLLFGFFQWKAFYIIFVALIVALTTGLIYQWLERKGWIEKNVNTVEVHEDFSIRKDMKMRFKKYKFSVAQASKDIRGIWTGIVSLSDMVLWWILIGMVLASLAGAYIPSNIFQSYLGPSFSGLVMTLILATVIEVCSEGSSPLAFEIYRQTGALGNSFVFLMAGVVTDYTELGLIWQNMGKSAAMWLPVVTVPQVLFWGWLANIIF